MNQISGASQDNQAFLHHYLDTCGRTSIKNISIQTLRSERGAVITLLIPLGYSAQVAEPMANCRHRLGHWQVAVTGRNNA